MNAHTTIYLTPDDLAVSAVSPVYVGDDGVPWATVTFGDGFAGTASVTVHNDPGAGATPLHVAVTLERLAADLRTVMAAWLATPEADAWVAARDVVAEAEGIAKNGAQG